jgi:hypothetical protein
MASHESDWGEEFNQRTRRSDGAAAAAGWSQGLTILRELMRTRLREDVEENFGLDSLQLPTSPVESERRLDREIALFQAAVASLHARDRKYVAADALWLAEWLIRIQEHEALDAPEGGERLSQYLGLSRQEQRSLFTNAITKILPAASRAPLVLFRLFPVGVRVVTATALGDERGAEELRGQQRAILPAIDDCPQCHAAVLPAGQVCPACSNPLWGYRYLTAAD